LRPLPTFLEKEREWPALIQRLAADVINQYGNNLPSDDEIAAATAEFQTSGETVPGWTVTDVSDGACNPYMKKKKVTVEVGACVDKSQAIVKMWRVYEACKDFEPALGAPKKVGTKFKGSVTIYRQKHKTFCGLPDEKHVHAVHFRAREQLARMSPDKVLRLANESLAVKGSWIAAVKTHVINEYAA
jgi:hypothetical protein